MADNKVEQTPDATAPPQQDPLQSYVDAGFLRKDYTDDDVKKLVTDLQQKGKISYQQAVAGPPPVDQIDTSGIHPFANNQLDVEAQKAANLGVESSGSQEEIQQRTAPYYQEMARFKPDIPSQDTTPTEGQAEAAVQERPMLSVEREYPQPSSQQVGGGSQASAAYSAAIKQLGADSAAQKAAFEEEKGARQNFAKDVGGAQGAAAEELRGNAIAGEAQAYDARQQELPVIDEIHHLVQDYAAGHIDKDQWWTEKSVPQKIGAVVGAIAAGLGGGPQMALNYVNGMIDRNIARQQEEIHRKGAAGVEAQNLLYSMMKSSGNMQEAYDKTRQAMFAAAQLEVQQAATIATSPIEAAKIDEIMAAMQMGNDVKAAQQAAAAGAAPGGESGLQVDPRTLVTDAQTGMTYKVTDPGAHQNLTNTLDTYSKFFALLDRGALLPQAQKLTTLLPYDDNIVQGESINAALQDVVSKMMTSKGLPSTVVANVQHMLPDFGSRFAYLNAAKIGAIKNLLNSYKGSILKENGALPVQVTPGAGRGKHAGEWVYYAKLGAKPPEQSEGESSAPEKPKLDFQPKEK